MAKKAFEIRQERAESITAQETLINLAETENREFTPEEEAEFTRLDNEIKGFDTKIGSAERIEAAALRAVELKNRQEGSKGKKPKAGEKQERFNFLNVVRSKLAGVPLTEFEQETMERNRAELKEANSELVEDANTVFMRMDDLVSRGYSVDGDSGEKGGEFVTTSVVAREPFQAQLTLGQLGADIYTGLTGNVSFPGSEALTFDFLPEGDEVTPTDANVTGPVMKPKRLAGAVDISKKLIAQTGFNVEEYIKGLIIKAINGKLTYVAFNGAAADANTPTGLLDLLQAAQIQTGTAALPTWKNVVGLESMVKSQNATEKTLKYATTPGLKGLLKTTSKDGGSGRFIVEDNRANGYDVTGTTLMPVLNTNEHPVIFGDWSQLKVGFWKAMAIQLDPFTQAGKGKVRFNVEVYADLVPTDLNAFAARKNFILEE